MTADRGPVFLIQCRLLVSAELTKTDDSQSCRLKRQSSADRHRTSLLSEHTHTHTLICTHFILHLFRLF